MNTCTVNDNAQDAQSPKQDIYARISAKIVAAFEDGVSNTQGVVTKVVALDPFGHWDYKPAAEGMWACFARFRRDLTTSALQIVPER